MARKRGLSGARGTGREGTSGRVAGRNAAGRARSGSARSGAGSRAARSHEGDTTVMKIDSRFSPRGPMGQTYLAAGVRTAMRLWREQPGEPKEPVARDYETVGFVLRGRAELISEGQTVLLRTGDSWVVPRGARHTYRIIEPLVAVEATSPPAPVHGRDEPPDATQTGGTGSSRRRRDAQAPSGTR